MASKQSDDLAEVLGAAQLPSALRNGQTKQRDPKENQVTQTIEEKNKAFVLEAFDTLFNKRDYAAAERFWSPNYIQHSAHVPPGREGLFALIKGVPDNFHYENGLTVANGDYVLLHGRFKRLGLPANWIVVDIVRPENGLMAEHWDVIEDEVTKEKSVSGLPMFGTQFPE
jgi:predicted SnoaL-like aldol condensation-catalyzing enzyme